MIKSDYIAFKNKPMSYAIAGELARRRSIMQGMFHPMTSEYPYIQLLSNAVVPVIHDVTGANNGIFKHYF